MIVQCPSCGSRYRVNDANVPSSGGKITCPSCQHKFIVYPEEQNPAPAQGGGGSDDLEDKTSVAFRPDLNKLVNQMQQGGGQQQSAGGDDGVAATEVMSGDQIPDFMKGMEIPDDGTVEMKNPFDGGGVGMGGPPAQEDEAAPTEVVSGDMLDGFQVDKVENSAPAQPSHQARAPQQNQQARAPQQNQQPPAKPQPPAGGQAPSTPPNAAASAGAAQSDAFDEVDGPAGPNPDHDGPWKLKTNFGLTYEFPDTKSLGNWLSNREDLDGYELSGDGDNFHALDAWPQISGGPAQSGSQQPPSFQQNNPSPPQQPPSGPGAGAAGLPGNSLTPSQPAANPAPAPSQQAQSAPGKKIQPNEYRPPSRDGKWNGLLWAIVFVLLLVAGGMVVQMFGIYDLKGLVLGDSGQQAQTQPAKPAQGDSADQGAVAKDDKQAEPVEDKGPDPKIVKEVNRLIGDAERAVKNNRLQTASEKLQNAKLLDPERVEVYQLLAKVYTEMGQEADAEAAKKKVSELQAPKDQGNEAGEEASNK